MIEASRSFNRNYVLTNNGKTLATYIKKSTGDFINFRVRSGGMIAMLFDPEDRATQQLIPAPYPEQLGPCADRTGCLKRIGFSTCFPRQFRGPNALGNPMPWHLRASAAFAKVLATAI